MIHGFSKWPKEKKIQWILKDTANAKVIQDNLKHCLHPDKHIQKHMEAFSENVLTNFMLPYSIAPHLLVNGNIYHIPLVTEESSVVAAIAKAAKFWYSRGGFHAKVVNNQKKGHIHFSWNGDPCILYNNWTNIKEKMIDATTNITQNMQKRGGGIQDIQLKKKEHIALNYYQIQVTFNTCNAMGANFMNTCLEAMARAFQGYVIQHWSHTSLDIIMSILSNYSPACIVESKVSCTLQDLGIICGLKSTFFAEKFAFATKIAQNDIYRAATHNKGILNGIDALAIATGNDFRAIEAGVHAYAAHTGTYKGLTIVNIEQNQFTIKLTLPLMVGVLGGMTHLHPLVQSSLTLLQNPQSKTLMEIMAAVGLASNFSALTALITTGIQHGHMRMHLHNILSQQHITSVQRKKAIMHFKDKPISVQAVKNFLSKIRD